jgi:chemotaxis protein CheD
MSRRPHIAQRHAPCGFAHIQRFKDSKGDGWVRRILPGEFYVTTEDESITTVLGSCVSACIRDPVARIGGMNHFMLPEEGGRGDGPRPASAGLATRYGSYAMESLINELLKRGGRRERLEIKLFGGGRILASLSDVGQRNIDFIHEYLHTEGLTIVAEDLGDIQPRKVEYSPMTGKVRVKRLPALQATSVADREREYLRRMGSVAEGGDIELF